ncbi:MAG TPA: hypothetical protein VFA90_20875 [Terriglobales bacterium]|nr:hypothetical protein [Terriglobales bacterium]
MRTASAPQDKRAARISIVQEHNRLENAHDLEGVLATFGETAQYDDEPWENITRAKMACARSIRA